MVTDRVGPTITTLKAEVDYLDGEVKKLLNLLADERTENMRLRAALERIGYTKVGEAGATLSECVNIARAALEGGRT